MASSSSSSRALGCRADWDRKPGQSMDGDRMAIAWDNQEMWSNLWIDLKEHSKEIVFFTCLTYSQIQRRPINCPFIQLSGKQEPGTKTAQRTYHAWEP